jgi:hypothetical protein
MNYNRRSNRPDAKYYRETRRRALRRADGRGHRSGGRAGLFLVLLVVAFAGAAMAGWMIWRGI